MKTQQYQQPAFFHFPSLLSFHFPSLFLAFLLISSSSHLKILFLRISRNPLSFSLHTDPKLQFSNPKSLFFLSFLDSFPSFLFSHKFCIPCNLCIKPILFPADSLLRKCGSADPKPRVSIRFLQAAGIQGFSSSTMRNRCQVLVIIVLV